MASVWTEEKGLSDYIRLSEKLKGNEVLVLVGISKELHNQLPASIVCVPRTETIEELIQWYSLANVVLSLSKAETFGLTIAEAMSCGIPAVVYDNTAQPELISEDTGFVVKEGDIVDLYNKIQLIKSCNASDYKKKCREKALAQFDNSNKYIEYMKLYDSILKL